MYASERAAIGSGHAVASGTLVVRLVPLIGLFASIVSTIALAVVLNRVSGPLWLLIFPQRTEWVIPAGREEEILQLVVHGADNEIPKAERPSIASIHAVGPLIAVTFDGYPEEHLTIRLAEAPGDAFLRMGAIAAAWSGNNVPEPIRRYVSVIAKAPGWREIWGPLGRDRAPGAGMSDQSTQGIILGSLIAGNLAAALLLVIAGRWPSQLTSDQGRLAAEPRRDPPLTPLAALMTFTALGVAALAVAHFHFRMDDYPFLARATHNPSEIMGETRLLSTIVHYQIGVLLGGGILWFAASNFAFLAALSTCWGLLVYRLGFSRDASVLAGALQALGPGTFFLLRSGNGAEHLSATTCVMLIVLLTDLAAREADQPTAWRYGVLLLALCLSALGVFIKLPLMVVLPPSCWLWGRWLVRHPAAPMHRSATYLAFFAAVGGAIFALSPGEGSIGFLPSRYALAAIGDRLLRYGVAAAVLVVLGAFWGTPRAATIRDAAAASLAAIGRVLRSRVGRLPLMAWAVIVSALWFLPFALHAGYEGWAYYGMLAAAPLSAVGALVITTAADQWRARGWRRLAGACVVCVILLPLGDIRSELHQSTTELVPAWLDSVRGLAATRTRPERIVVAPACPLSAFESPLSVQMDAIFRESGIWWATGWYDVPVEFRDDASPADTQPGTATDIVTFGYCPGRPATIE